MTYQKLAPYIYNCQSCPTRCDGKSKKEYRFQKDVAFSEHYENLVIRHINEFTDFNAKKCEENGFPDIEITKTNGETNFYIEIKVQQRTFMSVKKYLPAANLAPSETIALNLSDLKRYFSIQKQTQKTVYIMWVLCNRLCIVPQQEVCFFYQNVEKLEVIYQNYLNKRRFRRKSGKGDIVNGEHKGVVVNYHFSLNELKEWNLPNKKN
ncbi:MAG: hypothetical protein ACPG5B_03970 [Chitinophagales bacterium]